MYMLQTYSYCDILLDNEAQGSGVYLPELDDPEHCHAHNATLWELTYLQVILILMACAFARTSIYFL